MDKKQQVKKLKMKYFWEQKFEEVSKFVLWCILIVSGGIFLPYHFGKFLVYVCPQISMSIFKGSLSNGIIFAYWLVCLVWVMILYIIIGSIRIIIFFVLKWVSSNLDKAESRARKELKMEGKTK